VSTNFQETHQFEGVQSDIYDKYLQAVMKDPSYDFHKTVNNLNDNLSSIGYVSNVDYDHKGYHRLSVKESTSNC